MGSWGGGGGAELTWTGLSDPMGEGPFSPISVIFFFYFGTWRKVCLSMKRPFLVWNGVKNGELAYPYGLPQFLVET